jgi:NAD(P)-dependent dehydrogenase (short-subunit alcohol dehydrogenase family)
VKSCDGVVGRKVFITGAGRGIGRATALALAEAGADVAVNDIDRAAAEDTAAQVRKLGRRSIGLGGDASRSGDVRAAIGAALEALAGLDTLVNNVGIISGRSLAEVTDEDWDRVMAVNVRSAFLCSREALPHLIASGRGRIVNLASIAARMGRGFAGDAVYGASKGAIVSFTRGLARELAQHGITVNAVAPGVIDTDMNHEVLTTHRSMILPTIPLGRYGAPEDIAPMIVFLVSDHGRYATGAIFDVNGGVFIGG